MRLLDEVGFFIDLGLSKREDKDKVAKISAMKIKSTVPAWGDEESESE